ncbi:MAG: hypothetical protein HQL57_05840 [Magnetococcales bacterium]|nr:hypothetical protein [Magnetococcales bacterium]
MADYVLYAFLAASSYVLFGNFFDLDSNGKEKEGNFYRWSLLRWQRRIEALAGQGAVFSYGMYSLCFFFALVYWLAAFIIPFFNKTSLKFDMSFWDFFSRVYDMSGEVLFNVVIVYICVIVAATLVLRLVRNKSWICAVEDITVTIKLEKIPRIFVVSGQLLLMSMFAMFLLKVDVLIQLGSVLILVVIAILLNYRKIQGVDGGVDDGVLRDRNLKSGFLFGAMVSGTLGVDLCLFVANVFTVEMKLGNHQMLLVLAVSLFVVVILGGLLGALFSANSGNTIVGPVVSGMIAGALVAGVMTAASASVLVLFDLEQSVGESFREVINKQLPVLAYFLFFPAMSALPVWVHVSAHHVVAADLENRNSFGWFGQLKLTLVDLYIGTASVFIQAVIYVVIFYLMNKAHCTGCKMVNPFHDKPDMRFMILILLPMLMPAMLQLYVLLFSLLHGLWKLLSGIVSDAVCLVSKFGLFPGGDNLCRDTIAKKLAFNGMNVTAKIIIFLSGSVASLDLLTDYLHMAGKTILNVISIVFLSGSTPS